MATLDGDRLVDWTAFAQARTQLGANFVRILGYFQEDGVKSVAQIIDETVRDFRRCASELAHFS